MPRGVIVAATGRSVRKTTSWKNDVSITCVLGPCSPAHRGCQVNSCSFVRLRLGSARSGRVLRASSRPGCTIAGKRSRQIAYASVGRVEKNRAGFGPWCFSTRALLLYIVLKVCSCNRTDLKQGFSSRGRRSFRRRARREGGLEIRIDDQTGAAF